MNKALPKVISTINEGRKGVGIINFLLYFLHILLCIKRNLTITENLFCLLQEVLLRYIFDNAKLHEPKVQVASSHKIQDDTLKYLIIEK